MTYPDLTKHCPQCGGLLRKIPSWLLCQECDYQEKVEAPAVENLTECRKCGEQRFKHPIWDPSK